MGRSTRLFRRIRTAGVPVGLPAPACCSRRIAEDILSPLCEPRDLTGSLQGIHRAGPWLGPRARPNGSTHPFVSTHSDMRAAPTTGAPFVLPAPPCGSRRIAEDILSPLCDPRHFLGSLQGIHRAGPWLGPRARPNGSIQSPVSTHSDMRAGPAAGEMVLNI